MIHSRIKPESIAIKTRSDQELNTTHLDRFLRLAGACPRSRIGSDLDLKTSSYLEENAASANARHHETSRR